MSRRSSSRFPDLKVSWFSPAPRCLPCKATAGRFPAGGDVPQALTVLLRSFAEIHQAASCSNAAPRPRGGASPPTRVAPPRRPARRARGPVGSSLQPKSLIFRPEVFDRLPNPALGHAALEPVISRSWNSMGFPPDRRSTGAVDRADRGLAQGVAGHQDHRAAPGSAPAAPGAVPGRGLPGHADVRAQQVVWSLPQHVLHLVPVHGATRLGMT